MRLFGPLTILFPGPIEGHRYSVPNDRFKTLDELGHSDVAYPYMKVVNLDDGMTYELQPNRSWKLFTAKGATGDTGKSIEFSWDGTKLGVRQEGQTDYQYVDLKGDKGDQGNSLEFRWNGTELGVRVQGQDKYTYTNLKGEAGISLEFHWRGTELGVRQVGQEDYQFSDLRGPQGEGLEFEWKDTQLGVRIIGQEHFQYVDLKGEKGNMNFATFEISTEDGCLYMNTSDEYTGPKFQINDEGCLEVVIDG